MYVKRDVPLWLMAMFAWRSIVVYLILSCTIWALYHFLGWKFLAIPFLPVGMVGTAVAFYVGFKNNSSYDRLWEARKIWGTITNLSRAWATWVSNWTGSLSDNKDEKELFKYKKELIYRQIAWINTLRIRLRNVPIFEEQYFQKGAQFKATENQRLHLQEDLKSVFCFLSKENEKEEIKKVRHHGNFLLLRQSKTLVEMKQKGILTEFEHSDLEKMILESYNQQGACERIKTFPLPRQYATFSMIFTKIFIFLLPFGIIKETDDLGYSWLTIPFTVLISWIFYTMEQIGDSSENPFENSINDIPMSAICRNIEIDLREILGETELPEKIAAKNGILM
jgi:ion channel-forming bestrophin family protein